MSWGASVSGVDTVLDALEAIRITFEDDIYVAGPTVEYAIFQERGTADIEARPFMRPAAERVQANPQAMLEKYGRETPSAGPAETLAIAVQNEAKRIADQKNVRDTGALIASITYEEV